jgi:hypothetical protein
VSVEVAVVGAGEVVSRCLKRGFASAPGLTPRWVFDPSARFSPLPEADIIRIPTVVEEACDVIEHVVGPETPVIIATPTDLHLPYALALPGRPLAIEKPLTRSLSGWDRFAGLGRAWFPMSYYLLEKALPLLVALDERFRVPAVLAQLRGAPPPPVQGVHAVTGCIL